jgi:TP901 family phage tail tape measure protein
MPQIVGTAVVTIVADATAFNATLAGLGAKTTAAMAPGTMGAGALSAGLAGVSTSIAGIGAKSTAMGKALGGFTLAAVAFGVLGGKAAYNFDTAMRRVGAITQATGKEFDDLDALAQKLGRDTEYTAAEAADGMTKLALAGFNVNEIMRAIPGTLRLASAGGFDLATATGIAADTLRSFAMEVGEVGRVNDVLSKTMTKTNTNLSELAYGMKFVAPVAAASKISFEETTAALGGLANAGLKGTIGGTALRGAIVKLEKPTKMGAAVIEKLGLITHDATGRLLPLENIIGQLEKTSFGTADAITLMGQRAGPGFLALVSQGSEALRVMTQRNKEAGQEVDVTSKALGFNKKQHDELRWAFLSSFDAVSGFKFNMDDTTAVLGAFIKRGASTVQAQDKLQKAMQATSNDAILPLIGATRKLDGTLVDSEGDVLSFQSVLRLLEGTGLTSAEALEIFGESGLALAEAMNLPAEEISKLSEKMANSGTAAEIAVKQMEGVKGGLKRFQSSLEGIAIVALGGKNGIINKMADAADAVALFFNKLMEESPGVLKAIVGIIFALGGLGIAFRIFGSLTKGIAGLVKMFSWLAANPAFIGFAILVVTLIGAYKASEKFREALSNILDTVKYLFSTISELLSPAIDAAGGAFNKTGDKASYLSTIFKTIGDVLAGLVNRLTMVIDKFTIWLNNLSPEQIDRVRKVVEVLGTALKILGIALVVGTVLWGLFALSVWAAETAVKGFAKGLAIVTSPMGLIIIAVTVLGTAFYFAYTRLDSFRSAVDGFVDKIQSFFSAFMEGEAVVTRFTGGHRGFHKAVEESLTPVEKFGKAVRAVYDFLADTFLAVLKLVVDNIKTIGVVLGIAVGVFLAYQIGVGLAAAATWLYWAAIGAAALVNWAFTASEVAAAGGAGLLQVAMGALNAVLALNPIGLIVVALVALGVALFVAYQKFEPVQRAVDSLWQNLQSLADIIMNVLVVAWNMMKPAVTQVADALKGIFIQPLIDSFSALSAVFHGDFSGALDIAKNGLGSLKDSVIALPGAIANLVTTGFDTADMMFGVAEDMITNLTDGLVDKMKGVPVIGGLAEALGGVVTSTFQSAGGWMDIVRGIFTLDPAMIGEGFGKLKDSLITQATVIVPGLMESLSNLFSDIIPNALDGIGDSIKDIPILGGIGTMVLDTIKTGFDIVGNLADIIGGLFTFDVEKIKEGLGGIVAAIGNFLIELPGRLIDYVGDAGEIFAKYFGIAVDWIVENLPTVFAKLKDLPEIIGTFIANLFGGGKEKAKGKGKKGGGKGGDDKDAGPSFFGGMIESAKNWILTEAGPKLTEAFKMFIKRIPPILLSIIKSAAKLVAVVVPGLIGVLSDWIGDLGGLAVRGLKNLGGILFNAIKEAFLWLVKMIPKALNFVIDVFKNIPGMIIGALAALGNMLFPWIKDAFDTLVKFLPVVLSLVLNFFAGIPGKLIALLAGLGNMLLAAIQVAFNLIIEYGPGILLGILNFFISIPGKIIGVLASLGGLLLGWLTTAFNWLVENGPGILATLWGWISSIPGLLLGLLGNLGGMLLGWLTAAFNWLVENGPGILATLLGWILTIPRMLVDGLLILGGLLFDGVKIAFNFIVEKGPEVLATVLGWVTGIPGMLIGGLGAIGEQLFTWAKAGFDLVKEKGPELLTGLLDFFKGIPGKLVDALGGAATGAFNFAAKIFNALRGFINDKLIKKLQNISVFGAKPFEGLPTIPDIPLAEGGIITKATNALIGEDGAEVVIPLTKPERAKELLAQSGLMELISKGSPGIAMSAAPSTPDGNGMASTVTTAMSSVVDSAVAALQPVKDWFTNLSIFAIEALKTFGETVWATVHTTFEFFMMQVLTVLNALTAFIAAWPVTISGLLANTGDLIWLSMSSGMGAFAESFKAVFADLGTFVTTWQAGLVSGIGGLPEFMGGIAGQITAAITGPFVRFASGIWNPFAATLTGALDQIPATANINIPSLTFPTAHEGGVIGGRLPETGGPFESSEMLVKMQRGEGVIPASVMNAMTPAEFETIRRGDFGERDPRADKAMTERFLPEMGAPVSPMPPMGGDSFDALPSSILEGLKDALKVTFAEAKNLTEQAFYAPKYLGGIASSAAMGGLGFVGEKITEANKAAADAIGGTGTAFPSGTPIGLPAAIERLRQVAGRPGNYRALIDYMTATQVPFRAVSMVRAGATTRGSGGARASLHASGRAVDFAGMRASRDSPELLRIYQAFQPVRDILQELIYSGPGGGFVRNPITRADHHDHVHAGLANGAIVSRRMTALLGEAGPEVVIPLTRPMRALQLAEESGLMGVLSQAAGQRSATQGDTGVPLGGSAAGSVAVQGLFPGQGNTYNIYGISMAQVIAEIEAREQASTRVNFTRR